jgi:hypothetical protein
LSSRSAAIELAALMLRYQCCDGERLLALLHADPTLLSLLLELHAQISRFPELEHIDLRPSWSADTEEELVVGIYTAQEVVDAEASLEQLDHAWWLERSQCATTRVIVDVRFSSARTCERAA